MNGRSCKLPKKVALCTDDLLHNQGATPRLKQLGDSSQLSLTCGLPTGTLRLWSCSLNSFFFALHGKKKRQRVPGDSLPRKVVTRAKEENDKQKKMLWLTSLLLTSFVCWGSHTFNYLPYCYMLNMTATNTTSYNTCIKGSDGKGVMTKIYVGAFNGTDGAGGVSAANKGECCIIDASTSPMPSGWSNQSTVSVNFKLWNTDILCPTGLFLLPVFYCVR